MDKRKIQYGIVVLMLAFVFVGCGQKRRMMSRSMRTRRKSRQIMKRLP